MQVGVASEEADLHAVAAQIGEMPRVHGAVEVAHQVDQHLQTERLLFGRQVVPLETPDELVQCREDVAFRIARGRFAGFARIDVHVVPALGVGVLGVWLAASSQLLQ